MNCQLGDIRMTLASLLLMAMWLKSLFGFVEWRVGMLEERGKQADLLHDWATQLFIRLISLVALVGLLLVA
jgi:hypothetical protein